jgi:hypothetical protein
MKKFWDTISNKFQSWAFNKILVIFEQYAVVSLFEFFNHINWFEGAFSFFPTLSQILDGLWWVDTTYVIVSTLVNVFGNRSSKGNNHKGYV